MAIRRFLRKRITFLYLFMIMSVMTVLLIYAHSIITKKNRVNEFPPGLMKQIVKLNSSIPQVRWFAAHDLGKLGTEAIPAIPYLIENLDDNTKLRLDNGMLWLEMENDQGTLTSPSLKASESLIILTGKNFGTDSIKWRKWWDEKGPKFRQYSQN